MKKFNISNQSNAFQSHNGTLSHQVKIVLSSQAVVAHTFNPSTREAEVDPGLQSEFQDSQSYTEKSCLKKSIIQKTASIAAWDVENS